MSANLTEVESTQRQLFSPLKLVRKRKLLNQLPFRHPVPATRKTRFQRLVPVAEAWMVMEDMPANLTRKLQLDNPNTLPRCRDHHRSQMHRPLTLQVNIRFLHSLS